jgi:hypothetical protein
MGPALPLLAPMKSHGQIGANEAAEWRRRVIAWAQFNAVGAETAPSA